MRVKIQYVKIFEMQLKQYLKGDNIVLNVCIREDVLNFYLKNLEKEEQIKSYVSRQQEAIGAKHKSMK